MAEKITRTIAGMECLNKEAAAEYIGVSLSSLNAIIAKEKAKMTKVHLRFYQVKPKSPMWFPKEFLDSFVLESISKGGVMNGDRKG